MDLASFLPVACELLTVPSVADRPEELAKALDFVIDFVGPGFTVERFSAGGKPSALLYVGSERPQFEVIFNGHVDVVPAPAGLFEPRIDGDRLYGRGAHDMKVSALVLAQVFREQAASCAGPLGLQLVTDEEIGGRNGTRHQLEQGVSADFVIIGEQSGLEIVADSKGIATVVLRATGVSGHGAYPWRGDNALVKLLASIERVLAAYPVPAEEAWRTTVNVARIQTPNNAFNLIPDFAEAWLDVRFPSEDTELTGLSKSEGRESEFAEFFGRFCEPGVTVVVDRADPPHHADHGRPEIARLRQAVRRHGYQADFLRKHGSADGRHYYQRGVDAIIFGIGGSGLHSDEEYADIASIEPYYHALTEFLAR
ncbi:MAG TPA: M20 family metallopeptidase [Streptosporangiaceae bacterium]|jgi:succinyl-diaminopimelate desuccinylase